MSARRSGSDGRSPKLALLSERRPELETCGYCPKLCRAACPVSNAEPNDTLTPWGKMSISWFLSRGLLPADREHAAPAWACTACFAQRERCDHRNPVVPTLIDARADLRAAGVAPASAERVAERHAEREAGAEAVLERLRELPGVRAGAATALLVGCAYLRHLPEVASDIVRSAVALAGEVSLLRGCCGAPLLYAGDRGGYEQARSGVAGAARGRKLWAADPGCTMMLRDLGAQSLVEAAARALFSLRPLSSPERLHLRWHDPCQLGRGLGIYEEPRAILARLTRRAPSEFARRREHAVCSGAGGLLPVTMPDISRRIADERLRQHADLGGGTIVTACASSLRRFRSRGAGCTDLMSLVAESLTQTS